MSTYRATTRVQNLNVRKGPSIQTPVVGKIMKGATVEIDDSRSSSSGGWVWLGYNGNWACQKDPRYSYPFLTLISEQVSTPAKQPEPKPAEASPPPPPETSPLDTLHANEVDVPNSERIPINGSAVMYGDQKYPAESIQPLDANESWQMRKNWGRMSDEELAAMDREWSDAQNALIDANESWQMRKYTGKMSSTQIQDLDKNSSKYVQNDKGFPPAKEYNAQLGYFNYNYYMDYKADGFSDDLARIRHTLNFGIEDREELYKTYTTHYNRFKSPNPNDALVKTFPHVFFIRPDCNILERGGGANGFKLVEGLENNPNFVYANYHTPDLLRQLVGDGGYDSDFMMYLSNKAYSCQIKDEGITDDTYGTAVRGHKIAFGQHGVESKTAGDFSITFKDDRELHVYRLHKLWVDYISDVYQGRISPRPNYISEKVIDYATAMYYILTAEDGETIIFWSKYYGVFPTSIPSSHLSWAGGHSDIKGEIEISYKYSFKEDFNPLTLVEFNMNSGSKDYRYIPSYNPNFYSGATSMVGAPFIETFNNNSLTPYTFKLRFRPKETASSNSAVMKSIPNSVKNAAASSLKASKNKAKKNAAKSIARNKKKKK